MRSGTPKASQQRVHCSLAGCRFATATTFRLEAHYRRRHTGPDQGQIRCPVVGCNYRGTYTKSTFLRHQQTHREKVIPCLTEGCEYKTDRAENLTYHIERYHTDPADASFACKAPNCSYIGGNRSDLRRHTYSHTGERPYRCDVCEHGSYHRHQIVGHKLHVHKIVCTIDSVPSTISRSRSQSVTVSAETENKPGQAALNSEQLFAVQGLSKPLECSDCEHMFKAAKLLANHRHSHFDKGYECCNCGYFSKCASCMLKHRKRKSHTEVEELWGLEKQFPTDRLADASAGMVCSCEDDLSGDEDKPTITVEHYVTV